MKKWILGFLALTACVYGQHKSPEEIQEELDSAETQFKHAKEMFNPWYAGPLLTGSATMMPYGQANIQPYVFGQDIYAAYNSERHSVSAKHNFWNLQGLFAAQTGINSWSDIMLYVTYNGNWTNRQQSCGFGDTTLLLGLKLLAQGLWVPAIKLYLNEQFPSGRYENLCSTRLGTDATGVGSYVTSATFAISKLFLWQYNHPLNLRLNLTYYVPTTVHVEGYNAYGGGRGTEGKVHPGLSFKASFGAEYSFTQRWVLANDIVYTSAGRTKFIGTLGKNADGSTATVGKGSSDQLSLAPAIEYNPFPNLGIIGGAWFTVYGRNSATFVTGILTVTYTFSLIH